MSYGSDVDKTAASTEYNQDAINLTSGLSLTATRKYILPLVAGSKWFIFNNTTGGQLINLIGSSGNGCLVVNGALALVRGDGTNINCASQTLPTGWAANDNGSTLGTSVIDPFPGDERCWAKGANYEVCDSVQTANNSDATTWVNLVGGGGYVIAAGESDVWVVNIFAQDYSGASNAPLPNFHNCSLTFYSQLLANGTSYFFSQPGGAAPTNTTLTLTAVCAGVVTGCTSSTANTGCSSVGTSPSMAWRVLNTSGKITLQQQGFNTNAYRTTATIERVVRKFGAN